MKNRVDGSELKQLILQIVASVPRGKVISYGQVARLCGYSSYARYVGTVLKQLPRNTTLPWYRVINGKGEIAFPVGSESYIRQYSLLAKEGVNFKNGKISLSTYSWLV